MLRASIISAIINVVFNFILIPYYGLNAAAFTTALAEGVALCVVSRYVEKDINIGSIWEVFGGPTVGCIGIGIITFCVKQFSLGLWIRTCLIILLSVLTYICVLIIMKNKFALDIVKSIISRIKNRKDV